MTIFPNMGPSHASGCFAAVGRRCCRVGRDRQSIALTYLGPFPTVVYPISQGAWGLLGGQTRAWAECPFSTCHGPQADG